MVDITEAPSSFDAESYLSSNSDVAEAVKSGAMRSAWFHAVWWGFSEKRNGLSSETQRFIQSYFDSRLPQSIPPAALRARVHGTEDFPSFDFIGAIVTKNIEDSIQEFDVCLGQNARVLDFGCGCGRILRHFASRCPSWKFSGTDIDEQAIEWCKQGISELAAFDCNNSMPPLSYGDETFDLVYSISIFNHLPEDMQYAWLRELGRITKRGAFLFLSVHNMRLAASNDDSGFLYRVGEGTDGLPDFYQMTYHSIGYIRANWQKYLDVVAVLEKRVNNHQDLVICRRR
jgi:2-polyprenyl-3-methyl-5-hydroxy-6-metoxy-1,4-benzoquinol methylase